MGTGRSIHTVAAEAHAYCWDNSLPPALECASGQEVEFSVRDASGGQLDQRSTAADVAGPARDAVRATIVHLQERRGVDREEAYAVASVVCDLRIHEVVDAPNWVVGCFVPDAIFPAG